MKTQEKIVFLFNLMKIAAVVILYHPAKDAILNIKTYYEWVDKIFVFDNSETESAIKDDLTKLSKVEFHQNFINEGIARRLNEACRKAIDEKFDWLLTMDQDSNFSNEAIRYYMNCFRTYTEKEKVAMFGTNRSREIIPNTAECQPKEIQDLITSGSLLNLSLFNEIGGFDELLFIDLVDNEYCARAKMKGFSIILFSNINLFHELGKQVKNASIKTLFLVKKKKEVHSPLRCYYMYRNLLYIENKYKEQNEGFTKKLRKDIIARIKICVLYGGEAKSIFKHLKIAKADFRNNRMGKKG